MKKVTIIIGPQGSGKTTKAIELIGTKKTAWVNSLLEYPHVFPGVVQKDTEVIVLDEAFPGDSLEDITMLITSKTIMVKKILQQTIFEIERPELIITSNWLKESDFTPRPYLEIITCNIPKEPVSIHNQDEEIKIIITHLKTGETSVRVDAMDIPIHVTLGLIELAKDAILNEAILNQ